MVQLLDLPSELLQIIFDSVPNKSLVALVDLPIVGIYALNSLYSAISIGPALVPDSGTQSGSEFLLFRSVEECIRVLETNPTIKPRKLRFYDPFDAIRFAHRYARGLQSASIELQFSKMWDSPQDIAHFCACFKRTPFPVDCLVDFDLNSLDKEGMADFSKHVRSFITRCARDINLERLSACTTWLPNLTSLSVNAALTAIDIGHLPCQLKKLDCAIELQSQIFDCKFPQELTSLSLRASRRATQDEFELDFSLLVKLQDLSVVNLQSKALLVLKLPRSLKKLRVDQSIRLPQSLNVLCPYLAELKVMTIGSGLRDDITLEQTYPQTLRLLNVPYGILGVDGMANSVQTARPSLNLPSDLVDLKLEGKGPFKCDMFVDFEHNVLPRLRTLVILRASTVSFVGKLPESLTRLTLICHHFGDNDLEQLSNCRNLAHLCVQFCQSAKVFSYNLPDSLKGLELIQCAFKKFYIKASGLEFLRISSHELEIMDDLILAIPLTVERLVLTENRAEKVALTLPNCLQELDLTYNKLTAISNLPVGLKHLNCSSNQLAVDVEGATVFPLELESLNLGCNNIDEKWIERLNLKECTKLESLNLEFNCVKELDAAFLPKSLVTLDLFKNAVTRIKDDLRHLDRLEELELFDNCLNGFFESQGNKGTLFGDSIRYVNVKKCNLSELDVRALFDGLKLKPKFGHLNVDQDLVPAAGEPCELRDSRIGDLSHLHWFQ
ncbi:hypothetical protein Cantr_10690 [Candida viswanathii]|uniref:Uncharacterized protein n=1 Tax=Candida viswanathii TaxID=5486 RepID=A0A367YD19_9ASCO|nr:hypothetical protein Cantr_10690 [Candida viswanathii]